MNQTASTTQVQTSDSVALNLYQGNGPGKTCLFQHGLGGSYQQCVEVFPHSSDWNLATLECRGHGDSAIGDLDNISLAQFADDLIHVIETQLEPPIPIGGISMGAVLALRISVLRPDLISAVVLARPAWGLEKAPENMLPNLLVGELLTQHTVSDARAKFMRTELYRLLQKEAPDNLLSLLSFFDRPDARSFGHILKTISLDGPDISHLQLANWPLPTLIMATADDHVHPVELAESLADRLGVCGVRHLTPKHTDKAAYLRNFSDHLHTFLCGLTIP